MLGYYNYTVILTYLGLASSVFGIYASISFGKSGPIIGICCLMLSGFFDMFDGRVARTRKRTENEKKFGIQLDSLSDLVCFGILPIMIGYSIGLRKWWYIIFMILYSLCALIRLAYFNVTEDERQSQTDEARKYYEGLPVTTAAAIFPFIFCFREFLDYNVFRIVYAVAIAVTAICFISPFKIKKPGKAGLLTFLISGIIMLIIIILLNN